MIFVSPDADLFSLVVRDRQPLQPRDQHRSACWRPPGRSAATPAFPASDIFILGSLAFGVAGRRAFLAFVTRDFLSLPKRRAAASRAPQRSISVIQRLGLFPLASLPNGVDGLLALALVRCGGISRIIAHIRCALPTSRSLPPSFSECENFLLFSK
jgi:hypothetical protein